MAKYKSQRSFRAEQVRRKLKRRHASLAVDRRVLPLSNRYAVLEDCYLMAGSFLGAASSSRSDEDVRQSRSICMYIYMHTHDGQRIPQSDVVFVAYCAKHIGDVRMAECGLLSVLYSHSRLDCPSRRISSLYFSHALVQMSFQMIGESPIWTMA